jgi:ArsR family transcriptional regulator
MNRTTARDFKALGDPNRIRIIKMLEVRELCVCEVREVLGLSTSTVSKHLSILRDAELIVDAKDGKWVNYRLNDRADGNVVRGLLDLMKVSFKDDEQIRSDRKKLQKVDRDSICAM